MRRKTADPKVARLRGVSLFSACNDKELGKIASLTDEIVFDEGQVLTREGRPGSQCFVVAEGEARVSVDDEEVAVVGPGEIIGEMSLLDAGPRSATVTAITPMRVLVLAHREFMGLLTEHPSVRRKILRTLSGRVRDLEGDLQPA